MGNIPPNLTPRRVPHSFAVFANEWARRTALVIKFLHRTAFNFEGAGRVAPITKSSNESLTLLNQNNWGCPPSRAFVKSRDILYILSLDILYIGGEELGLGIQRSMIFECWIPGSSSRIRVVQ